MSCLDKKNRIAVYLRNQDKFSLENNRNRINAILDNNKFTLDNSIIKYYEDLGYSGIDENRPALKDLLFDIENNKIDILITPKIETLSRDISHNLSKILPILKESKVELYTINGKEDIEFLFMSNKISNEIMFDINNDVKVSVEESKSNYEL